MLKLNLGSLVLLGIGAVTALSLAPLAVSRAQDTPGDRRQERREGRRAEIKTTDDSRPEDKAANVTRTNADEQLAAVLFAGCNNEVQIAKFALPMLNSTEAKQYAERLIKDHQAQCDKLEKLAGKYHRSPDVTVTEPKAKFEFGRLKLEASGSTLKAQGDGGAAHPQIVLDWVHIQQQMANECLTSTKMELQNNHGKHFDECFIGLQIAAHMKMVDQLKTFEQYASAGFRAQIDAGLEVAKSHLSDAKAIMESQSRIADKNATSK